jgi:hypothetical protein
MWNEMIMEGIKQYCIQIADTIFGKKYKDIENRKFIRLKDSISIGMRLVDSQSGKVYSRQIKGSTLNISREGLCIESTTVTVNGVDIFNDAMSDEKSLEIEVAVPEDQEKIKALGKVVWLDMTPKHKSFLFTAGVYLDLEKYGNAEKWFSLVESARKYRRDQSWIVRTFKHLFKNTPQ